MKYQLLFSCLVLCACFSEEEAEPEIQNSAMIEAPKTPLLELNFECPPEDISEYPDSDTILNQPPYPAVGQCSIPVKTSVEKLQFGKQGGVRCITTNFNTPLGNGYSLEGSGAIQERCKRIGLDHGVEDVPGYCEKFYCGPIPTGVTLRNDNGLPVMNLLMRLECPWLSATTIDERIIHISVDENKTGEERSYYIELNGRNCRIPEILITQSAE